MKQLRVRVEHEAGLHVCTPAQPRRSSSRPPAFIPTCKLPITAKLPTRSRFRASWDWAHQAKVELTVDGPDEDAAVDALIRCLGETTTGAALQGPNSDPTA
jgi:hypothetical protein